MAGEFSLIDWLRQHSVGTTSVPVGIGDDAAILAPTPGEELLVTTDMLMDGRHFIVGQAAPELIGRKALAVNLSDIAAMAGRPLAAFVSWALPRAGGRELAERLFTGMQSLADQFQVAIAGGDTNSWDGPLVINITLVGETVGRQRVLRQGAQPGDGLYVTGPLGGSLAGRHLTFTPRLREARVLATVAKVTAMLDLSDGVASDLRHILRASQVGVDLDGASVPIHPDVSATLAPRERLQRALTDGEDFELLFTAPPLTTESLHDLQAQGVSCMRIGTIRSQSGCDLHWQGQTSPLPLGGWEHGID